MKRKRDFPQTSLKTLKLWEAREHNAEVLCRIKNEIEAREKELQQ